MGRGTRPLPFSLCLSAASKFLFPEGSGALTRPAEAQVPYRLLALRCPRAESLRVPRTAGRLRPTAPAGAVAAGLPMPSQIPRIAFLKLMKGEDAATIVVRGTKGGVAQQAGRPDSPKCRIF